MRGHALSIFEQHFEHRDDILGPRLELAFDARRALVDKADDIAALIARLGLERADVAGYSVGGGVTLQLGLRHPERVRKLVVISAPHATDGWFPEVLAGTAAMDAEAMTPRLTTAVANPLTNVLGHCAGRPVTRATRPLRQARVGARAATGPLQDQQATSPLPPFVSMLSFTLVKPVMKPM